MRSCKSHRSLYLHLFVNMQHGLVISVSYEGVDGCPFAAPSGAKIDFAALLEVLEGKKQ